MENVELFDALAANADLSRVLIADDSIQSLSWDFPLLLSSRFLFVILSLNGSSVHTEM